MKFSKKRMRIDNFLVENKYYENISQAAINIMLGNVFINGQKINKAGEIYNCEKIKNIEIKKEESLYVSRGGLKLKKAIDYFKVDFNDKIILDIGASTGGFTDCALKHGAKFVYAIDVGTNQLDWKLRNNEKVKSIENMHINDLELDDIENNLIDIIVMDVSFISLKKILKNIYKFISDKTICIFLIKPQFEVTKEHLEKGIVKDINIHKEVLENIRSFSENIGIYLTDLVISPIKGTKGNIEYLGYFTKDKNKYYKEKILESINNIEGGQNE